MFKQIDKNNNTIYGDLSKQRNLKFHFKGKDNILFFAGSSTNLNITFHGNNTLVFVGDKVRIKGDIDIRTNGLLFVGQNSSFNGIRIMLQEGKNIIFGNDCMFSWQIWIWNGDGHTIYDAKTHQRVNFSKSIYVGDHIWCGQEAAILKGVFVASGSMLGGKSVGSGIKFSNAIYAGNPAKLIKEEIFWDRRGSVNTGEINKIDRNENFIYEFNKQVFLNPVLLERELDKLESASQKLEFVFDYIHNNTHKNRFALFKDSDTSECKLYKDESKPAFKTLKFETMKNPAVFRVKNSLTYRLGGIMISHSKSFKGYLTMPFALLKCSKEFKKNRTKQKLEGIKVPPLENLIDYKESLAYKNHLTYKLGSALIKAHKAWYKGGYIWLYFEILRIKRTF